MCIRDRNVGALLARLPATGHHNGPLDGGALLTVDVLGVAETKRPEVLAGEVDAALGTVKGHGQALVVDARDLATRTVLNPGLPRCPVFLGERDQVALAQPVMLVRQRQLVL